MHLIYQMLTMIDHKYDVFSHAVAQQFYVTLRNKP